VTKDRSVLFVRCPYCCRTNIIKGLWLATGLNNISADLHTINNYTRLLQQEQQEFNKKLNESRRSAEVLCARLPQAQDECNTIKEQVTDTRLAVDYWQVMISV